MRLDTGNRSFLALVVAASIAAVLAGMAACMLLGILAYRVAVDGPGGLVTDEHDLRPALALLSVIAAGMTLGAFSLRAQLRASRRLVRRLGQLRLPPTADLQAAAAAVRLDGRVHLVDADEAFSFTYGVWAPRVAVSRGLLHAVEQAELRAVLAHERYHVRNLDPLRVLVVRVLQAGVFYLPALRELGSRYVAGRELAADRRALRACGRAPLAGALLKVVRGPAWSELSAAAAIGGPELLGIRIRQLESGREPRMPVRRLPLVLTAGAGALLIGGFALAVDAAGGFAAMSGMRGGHVTDMSAGHVARDAAWLGMAGVAVWLGCRRLARQA